jgi:hypothetical protein
MVTSCSVGSPVSQIGLEEIVAVMNLDNKFAEMIRDSEKKLKKGNADYVPGGVQITSGRIKRLQIFTEQQIIVAVKDYLEDQNNKFSLFGWKIIMDDYSPIIYPSYYSPPLIWKMIGTFKFSISRTRP